MIGNKKGVRRKVHRCFAWLMAGICLVTSLAITPAKKIHAKTEGSLDLYEEKKGDYSTAIGYREYMANVKQNRPADVYVIEASDYVRTEGMIVTEYENYQGKAGKIEKQLPLYTYFIITHQIYIPPLLK